MRNYAKFRLCHKFIKAILYFWVCPEAVHIFALVITSFAQKKRAFCALPSFGSVITRAFLTFRLPVSAEARRKPKRKRLPLTKNIKLNLHPVVCLLWCTLKGNPDYNHSSPEIYVRAMEWRWLRLVCRSLRSRFLKFEFDLQWASTLTVDCIWSCTLETMCFAYVSWYPKN